MNFRCFTPEFEREDGAPLNGNPVAAPATVNESVDHSGVTLSHCAKLCGKAIDKGVLASLMSPETGLSIGP